jgi:membrane protease YdiL (CAAX protease family)
MGPEPLWQDVSGQLLWGLLALGGATLLPEGSLAARLGLVRGRLGAARIGVALVGFLALSNALHGAVSALGWFEGTTLAEIDRVAREASPLHPGLVWLAMGLAPALGEELLFRGFLLRLLARRWPGALAAAGSAAVFGAAHLDLVQGAAAFALGAYLAALTLRAGSLWPAILCHLANNTLALGGSAGLVPPIGAERPLLAIAIAAALAAGASALWWRERGLWWREPRLQPRLPPADGTAIPRGPHDPPGPDRR